MPFLPAATLKPDPPSLTLLDAPAGTLRVTDVLTEHAGPAPVQFTVCPASVNAPVEETFALPAEDEPPILGATTEGAGTEPPSGGGGAGAAGQPFAVAAATVGHTPEAAQLAPQ